MTILIILLLLTSIHIDNSLYRLIIKQLGGGVQPIHALGLQTAFPPANHHCLDHLRPIGANCRGGAAIARSALSGT